MAAVDFVRELFRNVSATSRLERRYYWFTNAVGLLATVIAAAVMTAASLLLARLLEVRLDGATEPQANTIAWGLVCLAMVPFVFYLCAAVVSAAFAAGLRARGQMTGDEARQYVWRWRYPAGWFRADTPRP